MGKILEFIQQHSAGKYFCYGSKKVSLDDNINERVSKKAKYPLVESDI